MKKMFFILLIIVLGISLFIFIKYRILKKEIKITYILAQKYTFKEIDYNELLNSQEWIILSNEDQRRNWENAGYVIPSVDFTKNYIIISKYKIYKLYQKVICNKCYGTPDGKIIFDKDHSDKSCYYFYLMPMIMLTQGVG